MSLSKFWDEKKPALKALKAEIPHFLHLGPKRDSDAGAAFKSKFANCLIPASAFLGSRVRFTSSADRTYAVVSALHRDFGFVMPAKQLDELSLSGSSAERIFAYFTVDTANFSFFAANDEGFEQARRPLEHFFFPLPLRRRCRARRRRPPACRRVRPDFSGFEVPMCPAGAFRTEP